MPLDVMLGAMRALWTRAEALSGKADCQEERLALIRQASAEAHKAAAYVHPRLSSVDGGEDSEGGGKPQPGKRRADEMQILTLGSRDLARRLLFAIAFAEHVGAEKTESVQSKEKS